MAVHYSPKAFGQAFERRIANINGGIKEVHTLLIEGGTADHNEFTAGKIKSKQLRKEGFPFARANGGARGKTNAGRKRSRNPLPINEQTGELRRSFFKTSPSGINQVSRMGFRAKHARFVLRPGGTKKMQDRGFYSLNGGKPGIIRKRFRQRLQIVRKKFHQAVKK